MLDRHHLDALHRRTSKSADSPPPVLPLPALNGQPPVLLLFDQADLGVELAYEKIPVPDSPRVRLTSRASTLYGIPTHTPVFAVADGTIRDARGRAGDNSVVIEHRNGWITHYGRLERMFVRATDVHRRRERHVRAGDILGYVGTCRDGPLRTLRFELLRLDASGRCEALDPIRFMHRWRLRPWNDARIAVHHASTPTI